MIDTILILCTVLAIIFLIYRTIKKRKAYKVFNEERLKYCDESIKYGKYKLKKARKKLKETGSKEAQDEVSYWIKNIENWEKERYGIK